MAVKAKRLACCLLEFSCGAVVASHLTRLRGEEAGGAQRARAEARAVREVSSLALVARASPVKPGVLSLGTVEALYERALRWWCSCRGHGKVGRAVQRGKNDKTQQGFREIRTFVVGEL